MSEPNSHICPECSAPRASDGTPSCGCGRRASEALLETRTAEAAAAEDFDPLRIRPYVELGDGGGEHGASEALTIQQSAWQDPRTSGPAPDDTRPLRLRPPAPFPPSSAPPASRPSRAPRRRRRPGLVVALVGTAAAGVMAAAGIASGLFSYDAPERDGALPEDVRASAPDTSADGDATPVEPSEEAAGGGAPAPAPPGGAPQSKPTSPSPSPSQTSASPSASPSPSPTEASPSAGPSDKSSAADADEADSQLGVPKTLRLGDDDPEVTELQLRLRQLGLYNGDIDQSFDRQVEQAVRTYQSTRGITKDDEPGVYGLATRSRLESETKEP